MAPEAMKESKYSQSSDVYSFGMVLWELVSLALPFAEVDDERVVMKLVADRQKRPIIPANCPAGLAKLIVECWAQEAAKRPSFQVIVRERIPALFPPKVCVHLFLSFVFSLIM